VGASWVPCADQDAQGDRMASFLLEDLEGTVEALVFPEAYKRLAGRLAADAIVLVKGRAEPGRTAASRVCSSRIWRRSSRRAWRRRAA